MSEESSPKISAGAKSEPFGAAWRLADEPKNVAPLTEDQLQAGLSEARRIINNSAGYWFANEITPFDKAFKSLALRAIAQLENPDV